MAAVLVVVVAAAVAIPLTLESGTSSPAISPAALAVRTADQVNLHQSEFPAGWTVDTSPTGPLSGFLSNSGSSNSKAKAHTTPTSGTSSNSGAGSQAKRAFELCLGISNFSGSILGSGSVPPIGKASSPAFAAPSSGPTVVEAGSSTTVFSSDAPVTAGVDLITMPKFPGCFGTFVGQLLVESGSGGSTKVTFGAPSVATLKLPATPGVTTVGVDVTVPVQGASQATSVQLGVVMIGGGRIETTMYTFALGTVFPALLSLSLSSALGHRVATANTAVST